MNESLAGSLERVTYRNEETGYTVAQLRVHGRRQLVTVVGRLPTLQPGESLQLEGSWVIHRAHGQQFEVHQATTAPPDTVEAMVRYLASGLLPGVGPVMAQRIVDQFGSATLTMLDSDPQQLRHVRGLGEKKLAAIISAWEQQRAIRGLLELGQAVGLSATLALRIFRAYGDSASEIVQADPYRLALEIEGIGFPTADQIARTLGIAQDAPGRIVAGLRYALSEAAYEDGHCGLTAQQLISKTVELLGVAASLIEEQLQQASEIALLINDEDLIFLPGLYGAEVELAAQIHRLLHSVSPVATVFRQYNTSHFLAALEDSHFVLSSDQQQAVIQALRMPLMIITGGPGTGKTTTVRAILTLLQHEGFNVALAAPTGRAARRLAETTGHAATTIHRLLEYSGGGSSERWGRNDTYPLEADMVIIDEASMLDVQLAHYLARALRPGTHLLLVGDTDQLPSVGPGAVLRDLLAAPQIPQTHLEQIFRQAADSAIIANAHRINAGEMPIVNEADDFFWFPRALPEECAEMVIELVTERIPRQFPAFDPLHDIQVLAATHRGPVGVAALNERLQAVLNPADQGRAEVTIGGTLFREGDRVVQLRNNYELDVSNGDLGILLSINSEERTAQVQYDHERTVTYAWNELDDVALAYALSVHKAQGAEYPVVVIPVMRYYRGLLTRPLIYTAVTRACELVVLTGDWWALDQAVNTRQTTQRQTGLTKRLQRGTA